ncbi:MAG: FMN-binding protein, partial [Spirochaetales bacterium]|nr:FMN-binding protein [Candidatus Physcosoma equi]
MASNKVSQLVLLIVALVVFVALLTGLNAVTAPMIEANNNSAEFEPLYAVMSSAKSFQKLDVAAPLTVRSVWKETSGQGYVVRCATNKGYTGEYIELTVAIGTDGKISGISLDSYPETKDFGVETYPQTYVGNDSTLAGVQIVGGVTYSSSAFKGAVADAFSVLIDNGFIGAGVKEASQVITEMIPVVNADMCSESGQLQAKTVEASSAVKKAWVSDSGKSVAYWIENNGDYLAVIDADGAITVFDLDAKTVSNASVEKIADDEYQALLNAQAGQDLAEIMPLIPGAKGFKKLNVAAADTVKSVWQETSGLGYVVRSTTNKGFTHEYINLSTAFTADGKISNIVLETYPETRDFGADYPTTFIGQDSTLSGVSLVAGVTYSSSAFKGAVADAFAALTENGLVVEAVKEPSQVISEML